MNTQLDPDKKADECSSNMGTYTLEHLDPNGPEAKDLIDTLVRHHVAITSTLPVFEDAIPGRPPLRQRVLEAMTPEAREAYLYNRERPATMKPPKIDWAMLFKRDMQMEKAFAAAGGLLLAGPDPPATGRRPWIWRSARDRTPGGGRIFARRSHYNCDPKRGNLSGPAGQDRIH